MKRIANSIITDQLCAYGCGQTAKFENGSKKLMCCERHSSCPAVREKNATGIAKAHKEGKIPTNFGNKQNWSLGLTKDTDYRVKNNSLAKVGVPQPPNVKKTKEYRLAESLRKKQFYIDHPEKHLNRLLAGNRSKMTYPEQVAFDWLTRNNISFEHQKKIHTYYVDFCVGNKVIEIDGEHWHPLGNEKDKLRDATLSTMNYTVFRIRSKERIEDRLAEIMGM